MRKTNLKNVITLTITILLSATYLGCANNIRATKNRGLETPWGQFLEGNTNLSEKQITSIHHYLNNDASIGHKALHQCNKFFLQSKCFNILFGAYFFAGLSAKSIANQVNITCQENFTEIILEEHLLPKMINIPSSTKIALPDRVILLCSDYGEEAVQHLFQQWIILEKQLSNPFVSHTKSESLGLKHIESVSISNSPNVGSSVLEIGQFVKKIISALYGEFLDKRHQDPNRCPPYCNHQEILTILKHLLLMAKELQLEISSDVITNENITSCPFAIEVGLSNFQDQIRLYNTSNLE